MPRIPFEEYPEWARTTLGDDVTTTHAETLFKSAQNAAFLGALDHEFFIKLPQILEQAARLVHPRFHLFMARDVGETLELDKKSFSSAVDKAYRRNVLWNRNYPDPPAGGWVRSTSWFTQLDDILRTRLVCKYIDGPDFVANHLKTFAEQLGLDARFDSRSLDEGYYAYHFYVHLPLEIPVMTADHTLAVSTVNMSIELQLTTQFQEVLYNLTHEVYAATRSAPNVDRAKWKWDYRSRRFSAGYMGHTLHMLEGNIAQMRDSLIPQTTIIAVTSPSPPSFELHTTEDQRPADASDSANTKKL